MDMPIDTATPPPPAITAPASKDADSPHAPATSAKKFKQKIDKCKVKRKELIQSWSDNVDFRRGKPFQQESDIDRVNVNLDWSLTKGKHAQMFSQVPQVYLTEKNKAFAAAVPVFGKRLNERLTQGGLGPAVDESTLDCINAAGIGACMVTMLTRSVPKEVPVQDVSQIPPEMLQSMIAAKQIQMKTVPDIKDRRFGVRRLSPSDLLWDLAFTGSNFDDSDWIGHSGAMLWGEAKTELRLTDEMKERILGARLLKENLRHDTDSDSQTEDTVQYDELFYWRYRFDPAEMSFYKIHRLVFVEGIDEPVIDEPWVGQELNAQTGKYVGACKFPIRILTLTYISDDAIPPSDTAIGRPQIEEIVRSRSQMILQRDRSMPVRWYNVDRTDPAVQDSLMRGTFQGFIPVQGDGTRVIGEVARANYPADDYNFDKIAKQDLQESWQVGSNQVGTYSSGERSASEANIVQANFQSRIGYERSRVAGYVTGIAEVMAGLIALYDDFSDLLPDEQQRLMAGWDRKSLANSVVFTIRPDATVLLDSNQRIDKLTKLLNLTAKSDYINPAPIIAELVELHGVDPALVMTTPQATPPPPPSMSFSFKGEDMNNPFVVALIMGGGKPPSPEALLAARNLVKSMQLPMGTPDMPGTQASPNQPMPHEPVPPENWGPMERITKRVNEPGG